MAIKAKANPFPAQADFFNSDRSAALILIFCTLSAILLANSMWGPAILHFWHSPVDLSLSGITLDYSMQQWTNDGLMTVFFLMVGLDIKQQWYKGQLSILQNALLPIAAAIGGMLFPALVHFSMNYGKSSQLGMGIPMATDIAFSLAILSFLGKRVAPSLKLFLTALAIIDDLGAVLIIAIFYTKKISLYIWNLPVGFL